MCLCVCKGGEKGVTCLEYVCSRLPNPPKLTEEIVSGIVIPSVCIKTTFESICWPGQGCPTILAARGFMLVVQLILKLIPW